MGLKFALSVIEPLFFQIGVMWATLKILGNAPDSKAVLRSLVIGLDTNDPSLSSESCRNLDGIPQGEYSEVFRALIRGDTS